MNKIYNKQQGKVVSTKLLQLNVTDKYNFDMGHIDMANQLHNYYKFDHWLCSLKGDMQCFGGEFEA